MHSFNISLKRLEKIAAGFKHSSIMVIGDSMLDEYVWGEVRRISPEAPVPVVDVQSRTYRLGGAANVVQNLSCLGVIPYLVSVCGRDEIGRLIHEKLRQLGCTCDGLCESAHRKSTIKTRIMARHQQMVRVDVETVKELNNEEINCVWNKFMCYLPAVRGVIISDYAKGVVSRPLIGKILAICKKRGVYVAIDPKERHFDLYKGVSVITPNLKEAHAALGLPYSHCTDEEIKELGWKLVRKLRLPYLLITLSERGMALFDRDSSSCIHLPTVAQNVFDVTGAGDTVIGVYSAAITCGAKPLEAAYMANHAAGLTVAELGTACVTPAALVKACAGA